MNRLFWWAWCVIRIPYDLVIYHGSFTAKQVLMFNWRYFSNSNVRQIRPGVFVERCDYVVAKASYVGIVTDTVETVDGYDCSLFHCGVFVVKEGPVDIDEALDKDGDHGST